MAIFPYGGIVALAAVAALPLMAAAGPRKVTAAGRQLLVDGVPVHLKGVNWNPVPKGAMHPQGIDYRGSVHRDSALMQEAGINAVRTYECINDTAVLDALHNRSIFVLNTVFANAGEPFDLVEKKVMAVKDHPAILMWVVGNEWNYNGCYAELSHADCLRWIRDAARVVKRLDTAHPVATIYGRLPSPITVEQLSLIDVWGINYYHGLHFRDESLGSSGELFTEWAKLSGLPLFIGEYGADAWDTMADREDLASQAEAVATLTQEIMNHTSLREGGSVLGGMVFEFADEWWKSGNGNASTHEKNGYDWGGGPHPDMRYNEEWWGLVDIDRQPRPAYYAYKNISLPVVRGEVPEAAAAGHAPRAAGRGRHLAELPVHV